MTQSTWQVFDLAEIDQKLKGDAVQYLEFLNVPAQLQLRPATNPANHR